MKKKIQVLFLIGVIALRVSLFIFQRGEDLPDLTVIGPVKMGDGIGRQSVELMETFCGQLTLNFIPTNQIKWADVPKQIHPVLKSSDKRLGKVVIYEETLPTPNKKFFRRLNKRLHGPKRSDQIRIAYSLSESTLIPPLWVKALNTYFDAVAVPDEWLVNVYQNSGVSIPIFVLPLGLNLDPFLRQPIKQKEHDPFCFINLSSMIPRKNHEGLIHAFHQAFGDDPNVVLKINYRSSAGSALRNVKNLITSLGLHNVELTSLPLDNEHYLEFFLQGDVFVSLAKGEGFSIQPREAMALGMPLLISENTAHQTIIKTGLALAIPCPTSEKCYNPYLKCICGEEFVADIDAAASSMRHIYENYQAYLKKGEKSRAFATHYQYKNLKPLYQSLIKPLNVELGSKNLLTTEALITNSPNLYNKYNQIK